MGTWEGHPYIVTELLEGETLRGLIESGAVPVGKAVELASQIAQGLAAAHERGIVHRDLKPDNLFVTADGTVKILDFGLAKLTQPNAVTSVGEEATTTPVETAPGIVVGTVGYMSPEQLHGLPADPRSDVFSLGCVLYELFTGQRAFEGKTPACAPEVIHIFSPLRT